MIGESSTAQIFKAFDNYCKKLVAVKVLKAELYIILDGREIEFYIFQL